MARHVFFQHSLVNDDYGIKSQPVIIVTQQYFINIQHFSHIPVFISIL